MKTRVTALATLAALVISVFAIAPAHAAVPDITGISASATSIYPNVNNAKRPGTSTITVSGDVASVDHVEVRNGQGTSVASLPTSNGVANWNGRDLNNQVVAAGAYTVVAFGAPNGDENTTYRATITVNTKRLVRKTYSRTVTAASSLIDRYVGRCSTLRRPAKKAWKGSLGFHANTKCKKQTAAASAVSTQHVHRLPAAEQYLDMRVDTYGGAARSHKRSRGMIHYFQIGDRPLVNQIALSPKVGTHRGQVRGTTNMVAGGYISWGFLTAFKSRYDVKSFTVVVHYDVLG